MNTSNYQCNNAYAKARASKLTPAQLLAYRNSVSDNLPWYGFRIANQDLQVFKKAYLRDHRCEPCIINLVIPKGTVIYGPASISGEIDTRKMRAEKAIVHSIVNIADGKQRQMAHSGYDSRFKYRPGDTVVPDAPFGTAPDACKSGIHFFFDLHDALSWY